MTIAAKLYNKMILKQYGFKRGRSTHAKLWVKSYAYADASKHPIYRDLALVFVDFSKVFDSADRSKMFEILKLYGIPEKIISAIKVLYTDTSSTILTHAGETPYFSIKAGILQGDTLATFLFIIVVDYVLRMLFSVQAVINLILHMRMAPQEEF